ncbi:MFS transporter [Pradoshia sp.]
MSFRQWDINLKVRLLGEAFVQISFWTVFPFLAIYFAETMGVTTASVLLMLSQIIAVAFGLFGGFFADHFGRKQMMLIAIVGEVIGYGIFAIASHPGIDSAIIGFIGFTVASLFSNIYQPAAQAMVADVVEPKNRSYVFSVFYMMTNIAVVIGPLIGAVFFTNHRFWLLIIVTCGASLLFLLLFLFSHETMPAETADSKKPLTFKQVLSGQFADYRVIFTDQVLLLFILAGILISQTFMQLDLFIPIHITETVDEAALFSLGNMAVTLSATELFGLVVAINGGIVALCTVLVTKWMMRYQEKYVFAGSSILYGLSILLMGLFPYPWMYIVSIVIFSLAELMTVGIAQNFVSIIAPEHQRAMYFSAAQLRFSIGRVLAPLSITLTGLIGSRETTYILAFIAFVSALIYLFMYRLYAKKAMKAASI